MTTALATAQLTGQSESHLVQLGAGHRLQSEVARAFEHLQRDAAAAGFELAIASSFRSFSRQLAIWNGKASGERPVHDDAGRPLALAGLSPTAQVHAILRYSALPGASRHHWGTDLDVFDAAALGCGEKVRLEPDEVAPGGVFDPLHCWLDERMAAGQSHGFFRPYAVDRGGVAPERWHLSYAPLSRDCGSRLCAGLLARCWDQAAPREQLLLREALDSVLPELVQRYVSVPEDWCPAMS